MAARLLLASRRGVADRRVSALVESVGQDRLERSPRTDGGLAPLATKIGRTIGGSSAERDGEKLRALVGKTNSALGLPDTPAGKRPLWPADLPHLGPLGGDRQF